MIAKCKKEDSGNKAIRLRRVHEIALIYLHLRLKGTFSRLSLLDRLTRAFVEQ